MPVAVTLPAVRFETERFVDVALVVVPFVIVELVIVAFVAKRLVKFASAEVSESITPVVKWPTDEKNDVVVALVPVALLKEISSNEDVPVAVTEPVTRFDVVVVPKTAFDAKRFVLVALVVVPKPIFALPAVRSVVVKFDVVRFVVEAFNAERFVDVAFVVVPFVMVELVIVAFVAKRSVKFASADVSESITPEVKCPTDEKNDVVVAFVPVASPNDNPLSDVCPDTLTFPANVDVAFVDVALIAATCGVDVATI